MIRRILAALAVIGLFAPAPAQGQSSPIRQAYTRVLDEGGTLPQQSTLNCVGAGIVCADDAGHRRTTITVSGAASVTLNTTSPLGGGGSGSSFTLTCTSCVATARSVISGAGLSGGGDLSADRTLTLKLNASGGLSKSLGTGNDELGISTGGVSNAMLASSSVTISTSSPLGGGGSVSLGGTLTLTCATCATTGASYLPGTSTTYDLGSGSYAWRAVYARHLVGVSSTPSATPETALGVGGSCSVSGTDTAGVVSMTVPGGGSGTGALCTITFAATYSAAPVLVVGPASVGAWKELVIEGDATWYYDQAETTTAHWQIDAQGIGLGSGTYLFTYIAVGK